MWHTCCYWRIPYITFSAVQTSQMPFYYVQDAYHKNQLGTCIISGKGNVASVNKAGGSEPLRRGFRGQSPLRKFLGSKWYLDWFNDTGKTFSYSIQYKNLLKYKFGFSWPFSYVCTINLFLYIILSIIKEQRCLKNAIHQLERIEWLLLSAFQQDLQQKLVFVLTQENAFT